MTTGECQIKQNFSKLGRHERNMFELEYFTTPAGLYKVKSNCKNGCDELKKTSDKITPDDLFDFENLDVDGHVKALKWARKQKVIRSKLLNLIKLSVRNNLHKAVSVSSYTDTVRFSQVVQLHIIDAFHYDYGDSDILPEGRVLSANIPNIKETLNIVAGCNLRGGNYTMPCVRNTFQFLDIHGGALMGHPIRFGVDFLIKLNDSDQSHPLYIEGYRGDCLDSWNLRFTSEVTPSCFFRIRHPISHRRTQYDGAPVPPDIRIVVQHTVSGLFMATEFGKLEENIFGMEPIIDLKTCIDPIGIHSKENMFVIYVG